MLDCKTFEVRDRGTFIPCVGIRCRPSTMQRDSCGQVITADNYLLRRAGYSTDPGEPTLVLFGKLHGDNDTFNCDQFNWRGGSRTMEVAHEYVTDHWDELSSGAVIDVEFILGERASVKESERVTS